MINNESITYYKDMIKALDECNYDLLINKLIALKDKLDCRFIVSERENEFLSYCKILIGNQEYSEFRRLLTGKINKGENSTVAKASILDLSSYRKAI